ncbi:hypothetical protein Clocel_1202 [Clostridium cellulovorans 743B]|uniref:Uncharacterized protein n=1 Tax=Clostridium cellulovorans (strain ATCC 35296 / DSM 3052 / OCM 3 / 743B) TaxID=573061 RepID=D9SUQ3_CLOC7|nr:hypothetical protein Clocel_1202 [Clostridium cellulovorans 743B]
MAYLDIIERINKAQNHFTVQNGFVLNYIRVAVYDDN